MASKTLIPKIPPIGYIVGIFILVCVGLSPGSRKLSSLPLNPVISQSDPSDRTSTGERAFFPEDGTADKSNAVTDYRNGFYALAKMGFERSLAQRLNDPESVIYRNNAKAAGDDVFKIAVSVPATTDANGTREILRGVAQAQTEINAAGGIKGRSLVVVIANDDNDIKTAQQIAQSFVNRADILGVVGHYASSVTLATADIYTKGQLVAISPISSAVQLSSKSPYVFRTVPSDMIAARSLVDYMQTLKRQRAVIYFNSQSDYSKSLKGELSTAIALQGGQVVSEVDLSNSSFSANRSLQEATQRNADVILLASNTSALDRALQVVQANQSRLPILAGDDVYTPKTLDVTREQGQNMVIAVPWHILGSGSQNFAVRSHQLWGGDVNWRTVTAYDATQALGVAIAASPTRTGVQQALLNPAFTAAGASRAVTFLPSGDRNAPVQLVKLVKGDRSNYGYDFVPIP